jgi:hypothetical protein
VKLFFRFGIDMPENPLKQGILSNPQAKRKSRSARKFTARRKGKARQAITRSVQDHSSMDRMKEKREGDKQGKGTNGHRIKSNSYRIHSNQQGKTLMREASFFKLDSYYQGLTRRRPSYGRARFGFRNAQRF